MPHVNLRINDKHRATDKILLRDISELKDTPGFAGPRSGRRQEIRDRDISSGTQNTLILRILSIPVGVVDRLSSAFDGLVGLQK